MASYKAIGNAERVFHGLNADLLIRPIRHRLEERVRVHVLIRTRAYYIAWYMQRRLAPMLFQDHDPATVKAARPSPAPLPSSLSPGNYGSGLGKSGGAGMAHCPLRVYGLGGVAPGTVGA